MPSYCPIGDATHNLSFGSGKRNFGLSSRFPLSNIRSSKDLSFSKSSWNKDDCDVLLIRIGFNIFLARRIRTNS